MKKIIIILLWIIGLIALIIISFMAYVTYSVNHSEEAMNEGIAFSKTATKEMCSEEQAKKLSSCSGIECFIYSSMFGAVCLREANGEKQIFCTDKPKSKEEYSKGKWQENYCSKHKLNKISCKSVHKTIVSYCSDEIDSDN